MIKYLFYFVIIFALSYLELNARVQYSLIQSSGVKCTNCHTVTQGAGLRNGGGWMSRKDISLIPTEWIGADKFFDLLSSNTFFDDKVTFGLDTRLQSARWGTPGASNRDFMVMQLAPYLSIKPFGWLELEGMYNIAYDLYTDKRYVGQNPFVGSIVLTPSSELPSIRVGYFQPTFGIRWDDHTILTRQFIGKQSRRPIVPDDYAEFGAQLDYENIDWLSLSFGAFQSKNMSQLLVRDKNGQSIPVVDTNSIGLAGRAFISPEIGGGFTSFIGGTYYLNGDYYIGGLHFGIGKPDLFSFIFEYMDTEKKDARRTLSFTSELTYHLMESVLPYVRAERHISREKIEPAPYYSTQFVIGAHIYLLPFIDILPEYRIFDREHIDGYSASWAFQIHIWY